MCVFVCVLVVIFETGAIQPYAEQEVFRNKERVGQTVMLAVTDICCEEDETDVPSMEQVDLSSWRLTPIFGMV